MTKKCILSLIIYKKTEVHVADCNCAFSFLASNDNFFTAYCLTPINGIAELSTWLKGENKTLKAKGFKEQAQSFTFLF